MQHFIWLFTLPMYLLTLKRVRASKIFFFIVLVHNSLTSSTQTARLVTIVDSFHWFKFCPLHWCGPWLSVGVIIATKSVIRISSEIVQPQSQQEDNNNRDFPMPQFNNEQKLPQMVLTNFLVLHFGENFMKIQLTYVFIPIFMQTFTSNYEGQGHWHLIPNLN